MKRVITAMGDPYLNNKLKEITEIEVISKDILYPEGIFETLDQVSKIDMIIISATILMSTEIEYFFNQLLKKCENTEIVIFMEENTNLDISFLNSIGIYKIYPQEDKAVEGFLGSLNTKKEINHISKEISELKEIILQKKNKNILKKLSKHDVVKKEKETTEIKHTVSIVSITGNYGIGKSVFSTILAQYVENKKEKVLLVDFDLTNSCVHTIMGIQKYPNHGTFKQIEKLINSVTPHLDVLTGLDCVFHSEEIIEVIRIKEMIHIWEKEYDYIFIDMPANIQDKNTKTILSMSNEIIVLVEPNLVGIKKAKNIIETCRIDWKMHQDKIKIIFNKTDSYKITEEILQEIFSDYEIWCYIPYDPKYSLFINQNKVMQIQEEVYQNVYEKLQRERKEYYGRTNN